MALSSFAPSAGVATGTPARSMSASVALCLKVSPSSLVTCTPTGLPVCLIPSRMALRTWSKLEPLRICSAGSTSKSRQSAIISVTRLRSASVALRCPSAGTVCGAAAWGGVCWGFAAGGAAVAPVPPASPLSWVSISAWASSISLWRELNCACSSAVSARLPSALAAFTMACCFSMAASFLCFGVIAPTSYFLFLFI